jgi:hypothetical protein
VPKCACAQAFFALTMGMKYAQIAQYIFKAENAEFPFFRKSYQSLIFFTPK